MKRTQLYLDDDLWNVLHIRAERTGSSISQLVRDAARERYIGKLDARRQAMEAFVGIRKDRADSGDSADYVRSLRSGTRLDDLGNR